MVNLILNNSSHTHLTYQKSLYLCTDDMTCCNKYMRRDTPFSNVPKFLFPIIIIFMYLSVKLFTWVPTLVFDFITCGIFFSWIGKAHTHTCGCWVSKFYSVFSISHYITHLHLTQIFGLLDQNVVLEICDVIPCDGKWK